MDNERNLGVTEARFALTILTCLLVAIGYIALLRLGGTKDTSVDIDPADVSPPSIVGPETPPVKAELPPRVLPLEPETSRNGIAERPLSGPQSPNPKLR